MIAAGAVFDGYKQIAMENIIRTCAIKRRSEWGARPPAGALEPDWNYDSIVVHYTGHDNLVTMNAIQNFDLDHRHWTDVAYHYAVSPTGQIFEGRQIIYKGSHIKLQNSRKVGIVCMGDFDSGVRSWWGGHGWDGDPVQTSMLSALERLSRTLMATFPIKVFGGHKEFGDSETCPGDNLLPAVDAMRTKLKLAAPKHQSL